MTTLR